MRVLSAEKRAAVLHTLIEGCSVRSTARLVGVAKDTVLNLLAVEYDETDAPAGTVTLIFSGGAALRLEVECLECELTDLGPDDLGTSDSGEDTERSGLDV